MTPMPKTKAWKSTKYRKWVSSLSCMICSRPGQNDPHHCRILNSAGVSQKPPDFFCIPLCRDHHNELHQHGSTSFEQKYQVSLPVLVMQTCQEWINAKGGNDETAKKKKTKRHNPTPE